MLLMLCDEKKCGSLCAASIIAASIAMQVIIALVPSMKELTKDAVDGHHVLDLPETDGHPPLLMSSTRHGPASGGVLCSPSRYRPPPERRKLRVLFSLTAKKEGPAL